jgi:hypothetical protein
MRNGGRRKKDEVESSFLEVSFYFSVFHSS